MRLYLALVCYAPRWALALFPRRWRLRMVRQWIATEIGKEGRHETGAL